MPHRLLLVWRADQIVAYAYLSNMERGLQRQFANFVCSRSAVNLSQSSVGTRERPHSPTAICSRASPKVRFQGGPVVRPENRHRRLWVVCRSSTFARGRSLRCIERTSNWKRPSVLQQLISARAPSGIALWRTSEGICGGIKSEMVAGLDRNCWSSWSGIRRWQVVAAEAVITGGGSGPSTRPLAFRDAIRPW